MYARVIICHKSTCFVFFVSDAFRLNFLKVTVRLIRSLEIIKEPAARALVIWIFGEYNSVGKIIPNVVPSVLKYLAWSFTSEEIDTKLQILNASAKVRFLFMSYCSLCFLGTCFVS